MLAEAPPITAWAGFVPAEVGAAGRNRLVIGRFDRTRTRAAVLTIISAHIG